MDFLPLKTCGQRHARHDRRYMRPFDLPNKGRLLCRSRCTSLLAPRACWRFCRRMLERCLARDGSRLCLRSFKNSSSFTSVVRRTQPFAPTNEEKQKPSHKGGMIYTHDLPPSVLTDGRKLGRAICVAQLPATASCCTSILSRRRVVADAANHPSDFCRNYQDPGNWLHRP